MRKLNKPLLRRLARKLRRIRHEQHYDQGRWSAETPCGTAACVAGHTIIEGGFKPTVTPSSPSAYHMFRCRKDDGPARPIPSVARELLGLSPKQADRLFSSSPDDGYYGGIGWPEPFGERWHEVVQFRSKERKSRIAADFLDAIADTNGKILA